MCYQEEKDIQELVTYMIHSFIQVLPKMPQNGTFSEEELDILKQFIEESEENAELSKSVEVILQGKKYNDEFIDLIASCAFLAIEHSYQFLNCLKLTMLMDLENEISTTWSACFWVHDPEWFEKHCILLEEAFPEKVRLRMDLYIVWCMKYKQYSIIERLSAHYPEKMKEALMKNEKQDVVQFLKVIKKGNPKFYETIKDSFEIEYQRKLVHELVKNCGTGKELLEQYLLGEAKADVLYPFLKEWREHAWSVMAGTWQTMDLLKKLPDKQVLRRIAVFTGLILYTSFFSFDMGCLVSRSKVGITYEDKQVLEELISIFAEEEIPFLYQLELFGQLREIGSYEYKFGAEKKDKFFKNYRKLMKDNQDWKDAAAIGAKEANPQGRCFCIRILHQFGQEYKDVLLDCAKDSSKQVKQLLKPLYEEHKEWESEIKAMLSSKKAQEREIAVQVLTTWGAEQYSQELLTAMEKEKSKKVKEYLKSALHTIKSIQISESTEANKLGQGNKDISEEVKKQALIAEILKGGRKRAVAWVYDNDKIPFPNVHTVEGVAVSEDYMKAILIAYADMSKLGINADAVELAKDLDSNELSEYMLLVWSRWLELRADTKKKWVLYATAIHGGEAIIPVIYKQIQEWPKHSRGAIAEVAIKALALNGSSMALLQINELASKSKYRQVRMAADDAFEYAAEQFGITRGELEDRIVPNFGFNQDRERVFDYGTRTFTVSLTSALELVVTDQKGKQLKNLPAPGKKDDERKAKAAHAEYKQLKKQLETVIKTQKVRLERIFATQRLWQADKWKELFVNNPIMHQFAIGLVWGRYEEEQLQETFRYMEDGSFNTVDEDEYEFPEIGMIGLVHPIELSEEDLEAWKEQLSDYEITQPISQLERPIYELSEEEKMQKELTRYQGENVAYYSMMKLLEMGWSMGEIYDGGITDIFYRRDGKFAVQLNSLGLAVRYGYMDSYVTI
ncbi:MAG: DUF4132 domain-containing protein, partial [Lachnospiraceae bacterium]|nr:DUF4132 domain-containing protein [Lachnospiraceae bacterium]